MKCVKCSGELIVKVGSRVHCEGCSILSNMTTVVTVRCDACDFVFQAPVQSKNMFSVKKD